MKRSLILLILFSSNAFAFLGPPCSRLNNQLGLGIEYSQESSEWEIGGFDFLYDNVLDVESRRILASFGSGNGWLDLFFLAGVTALDFQGADNSESVMNHIDQGRESLALGAGFRLDLRQGERLSWGLTGRFLWSEIDIEKEEFIIDCADPYIWGQAEFFSFQAGLGPTLELFDGVLLYGGPFFYFLEGEIDVKIDIYGQSLRDSGTIEAKDNFGAWIGVQFFQAGNLSFSAEYQRLFGGEDSFGVEAICRF